MAYVDVPRAKNNVFIEESSFSGQSLIAKSVVNDNVNQLLYPIASLPPVVSAYGVYFNYHR